MNEWEDRLVDASLHELHGRRPPDLSSRVLSALERGSPATERIVTDDPAAGAARVPARRLAPWLLAAAAVVVVGLVFALRRDATAVDPVGNEQVIARLEISVLRGELRCVEMDRPGTANVRHTAGAVVSFAARPGNRLLGPEPCQVQVGPFGLIEGGTGMELEVKAMEFTWKNGVVAASSLTLAVVGGVVTWHSLVRSETASAGETLRLQASPNGEDAAALAETNERLRRRIRQLEQEVTSMKVLPVRDAADTAVEEPPPPPPPVESDESAMVFTDPVYAAALSDIDWKLMGAVTKDMGPLLAKLVEMVENGEQVSPELDAEIKALNSKLEAQMPTLMKASLPGFGPHGAYTHPLVAANVLANTLAAAGQPIDAAQQIKLDGLVRAFSAESRSIVEGVRDFDLEGLLAEVEMKDRFYREVASQLTPEQSVHMAPVEGRDHDGLHLFGTGLMLQVYARPIPVKNATDFARATSNRFGEALGLDDDAAAKVRAIVERVTTAAPELWRDQAGVAENAMKKGKAGRSAAALRRQIELMREIDRQVPMTPEQRQKFRAMKNVWVPLPQ